MHRDAFTTRASIIYILNVDFRDASNTKLHYHVHKMSTLVASLKLLSGRLVQIEIFASWWYNVAEYKTERVRKTAVESFEKPAKSAVAIKIIACAIKTRNGY